MLGSIYIPIQQTKPPAQVSQTYENGLTISADGWSINVSDQSIEFRGHVIAVYGPTKVYADRLIYYNSPRNAHGEAIGHVQIVDPEGVITAAFFKYNWTSHVGSAQNVDVTVSSLHLTAESADLQPNLWTLHNVGGTGCKMKTPLYYIHARELLVRPSVGITAIRPQLSILGQKLLTLPRQTLAFNGGGSSIDLPYPTVRSGSGLGVNWTNEWSIDPQTSLYTKYAIFHQSLPFYNGTLMRSGIRGVDPEPLRTEIGDRFTFGYFDSIQVRDPKSEQQYFKSRRFDYGIGSTFGADAKDTTSADDKIDKPIELLVQASGAYRGFGAFGLVRAQQVKISGGETTNRLILEQNLLTPTLSLGKNLSLYARGDAAQFVGGNNYRWLRGQVGLVYQPVEPVRVGVSYTAAKDFGQPDFSYDAPLRFRELSFRADLDFDTTQIRVLVKYDPTNRGIFDREFYFSRVVGCLEPYVVYRERPHKFFLGIKLPLARVFDHLSHVAAERGIAKQTISGPKQ
ncbi:MAG TPA: hypothetical protein VG820_05945 [Fimbriimonadaceae bacterium]|nr:hypothetical protein [Fimbriimonadaceae bacterium]